MLKADATGPSVPAAMGKAEAANHHRLGFFQHVSFGGFFFTSTPEHAGPGLPGIQMGFIIFNALRQLLPLLLQSPRVLLDMLSAGVVHF